MNKIFKQTHPTNCASFHEKVEELGHINCEITGHIALSVVRVVAYFAVEWLDFGCDVEYEVSDQLDPSVEGFLTVETLHPSLPVHGEVPPVAVLFKPQPTLLAEHRL